MPQAAPGLVAWYAGLTAAGKFVVMLAINMALSYVTQSLAGKKKNDAAVVRDGREVTVSGTTQPRQLLYGEWRGSFYGE